MFGNRERDMYARDVTLHLKASTPAEFIRRLEADLLPVLRKRNSAEHDITFVAPDNWVDSTYRQIAARN
jgi:hypothetical protein